MNMPTRRDEGGIVTGFQVVNVVRSKDEGKNSFFRALTVLLFFAIALAAIYMLWKVAQVIAFVFLAGMLMSAIYCQIFPKDYGLKSQIGKTNLEAMIALMKEQGGEDKEEMIKGFKLGATVDLFFNLISAAFILCFALDPKYKVFPVNLLGLSAFGLYVFSIIWALRKVASFKKFYDEKIVERSFNKKLYSFAFFVITQGYTVCLFLILFGIIGRAG